MKKKVLISLFLFFSFFAKAIKMEAFLTYATFSSPTTGPYIETYISVIGNSVKYEKNKNGKFQSTIQVELLFKRGEMIVQALKYNLLSPEIVDTTMPKVNFIDQQRLSLLNGEYDMEIVITDKNKSENTFSGTQKIKVDFTSKEIHLSDIEFVESYVKSKSYTILSKSGYDIVPYVSNFFPENLDKIAFYAEVYDTKKYLGENEPFVIDYRIESYETKNTMSNFRKFSKQKSNNVNIVLAEFPLAELPSGNYNLVVEVKNKMSEVIATKKAFFQRSNTKAAVTEKDLAAINISNSFVTEITNQDTLAEYIKSLAPISSVSERQFSQNQLSLADLQLMKQYFFNFWMKRNSLEPETAWLSYLKEVRYVNHTYGNSKLKGYNTDRGRVYLQYGIPDQKSQSRIDAGCYPYEIWQYYQLVNKSTGTYQTNKRFLFYSPNNTGYDFTLLHSEAIGETQERQWKKIICPGNNGVHKNSSANDNIDDKADDSGNYLMDLFNNPR